MSALRALQEAMREALHERAFDAFLPLVRQGKRESEAELLVYERMYWSRQAQSLREDFPSVERLLGAALFDRVAVTHCKRRPSRHPSIARLGEGFDATLTALGQTVEAAVARLEWAMVEAFWSSDAARIDAARLGALGEALGSAVLAMHPSLRRVVLPCGVRAVVSGGSVDEVRADPTEVVAVWRTRDHAIVNELLGGAEGEALARAIAGDRFERVCEAFIDDPSPAAAAVAALVRWVEAGWVCGAAPSAQPKQMV